jgi:hypothetical protein
MKKNIIILIAGVVLALGITTGCQKIKYKDDFRAPFAGKYACTLRVLKINMLRHEGNLLFSIPVTQSIKILGDSDLVLNQIYSVIYAKEKKGLDTVRFDYSHSIYYGMDTIYYFQNYRSQDYRFVDLTIKKDTISISIHEDDNNDYYEYSITGVKE